jgi:hypothetical protein
MNVEQERRLRRWLAGRASGEAPAGLRAAVAQIPYATRRAAFPAMDAAFARLFGPWAPVRPLLYIVILLVAALAIVGATLLAGLQPFPPRGLIAYSSPIGSDVRMTSADGSVNVAVTSTPDVLEHSARWSADGRTLVFARIADLEPGGDPCQAGVGSIVLYDLATGAERVVTTGLGLIQLLEWSPSEAQIGFLQATADCLSYERGVVDVATGGISGKTDVGAGARGLRWQGESIATVTLTEVEVPSSGGRDVARAESFGRTLSGHVRVDDGTPGAPIDLGIGGSPVWSPDGSTIAFIQVVDQREDLLNLFHDRLAIAAAPTWQVRTLYDVLVPNGSGPDGVTRLPRLAWTGDGRAVYWLDGAGGHIVEVASGQHMDLPAAIIGCDDLQWQPTPG